MTDQPRTPPSAPHTSPDGQWTWDGTQWVPSTAYQPGYGMPPTYPPVGVTAYPPAPSQNDGKAIASLVLSLLGLCGVGSLLGVILGHQSRGQAKREGRQPSGLALAGVIIGYVGLAALVLILGVFTLGTFVEGAFDDTTTCVSPYAAACP